jgi:hypothetical protein
VYNYGQLITTNWVKLKQHNSCSTRTDQHLRRLWPANCLLCYIIYIMFVFLATTSETNLHIYYHMCIPRSRDASGRHIKQKFTPQTDAANNQIPDYFIETKGSSRYSTPAANLQPTCAETFRRKMDIIQQNTVPISAVYLHHLDYSEINAQRPTHYGQWCESVGNSRYKIYIYTAHVEKDYNYILLGTRSSQLNEC